MSAYRDRLPWAFGLLVFVTYAFVAAPGFYWLDSAELSAAGLQLGSPHPTGFPLYMMMVKAASFLPVGELAFRVNLLSSLCAAIAVGGLLRLLLTLGRDDSASVIGAIAGASVLALSFGFARQATVAEVYTPTAAWIVLTLLVFEKVARGKGAAEGLTLAWMAGLGFGMHGSFRMVMGIPIALLLIVRLYRGARWPLLTPMLATLSALAVQLYLPVRSATGRIGELDWGHPSTLGKTLDHMNASSIRSAFGDRMLSESGEVVGTDLSSFVEQLSEHLGVIALLAGVVGLFTLWRHRRDRWLAVALCTMALVDGLYSVWINPMGLIDLQNGLPLTMCLAAGAGLGVAALARLSGPAAPFLGVVCTLFMCVQPAMVSASALGGVEDLPRRVSEASLFEAGPFAIFFSQSDSTAAGASYLQSIEGVRPDVAPLVLSMLPDHERVLTVVNGRRPHDAAPLDELGGKVIETLLFTRRPIVWERGEQAAPLRDAPRLGALSNHYGARDVGSSVEDALRELRALFDDAGAAERVARRMKAKALTDLGRLAFGRGKLALAAGAFEAALQARPTHAAARVNLGTILSAQGRLTEAVAMTERALEDEPNRLVALVNAARYRLALGDLDRAERHAERALRRWPNKPSAWNIAGQVDLAAGRTERARQRLERVLEMAPRHGEARAALRSLDASDN